MSGDLAHLGKGAQAIRMKRLVRLQIRRFNPQKILESARDVVTFAHFVTQADGTFETVLRLARVFVQPNGDIGHKTNPKCLRVQNGAVACDHARAFKFLYPAQAGRRRKPDPLGQFGIGDSPLARKDTQYMFGNLINGRHLLHILTLFPSKHNPQYKVLRNDNGMTHEMISALAVFSLATSITPGPNNLMLMASGANFGVSRTFPHLLGVSLGFAFMVVVVGVGLAKVFEAYPISQMILKALSVLYLAWLAWKIANAAPPAEAQAKGTPMTFLLAAAFQWVNPKAWAMAMTAISVYAADQALLSVMLVAAIFGAINLPSCASWAFLGQQMRRILTSPARLRLFNRIMAVLLIASLFPVLFP